MQHNLTAHYELAWAVADLVATHGTHDFRSDKEGIYRVVWLCGIKVYFQKDLPVRFVATNLDLELDHQPGAQPFSSVLGKESLRDMYQIFSTTYHLRYNRGQRSALEGWHDQLKAFVAATAVPVQTAA